MAVDAVSGTNSSTSTDASASSTSSSAAASASATLNYNDFLQLLIAQMKTQDPTAPTDASEQISQLASFSQVEQQITTNSHLETVLTNQMISQAASYVGKTVTSADSKTSGVVASVNVTSDGITATTTSGSTISIESGITVSDGSTTTTN